MKIFKLNNKNQDLTPHDRPFYPTSKGIDITNNIDDADYILLSSNPNDYKNQINQYNRYKDKMVVWVNNDNPDFLDDTDGVKYKLIAQPSGKKLNHLTVPLVMTDHILWHLDKEFIEECRTQEKVYDYCFMGQVYGKRTALTNLNINNYLFRQTGPIYFMNENEKHNSIKKFLKELGKCKFSFTPRGSGSNSFRLYECLMVGTIPIATDVIEYPYENEVNWEEFIIRGKMEEISDLIKKSKKINYDSFREKGMRFWGEFIKMDIMHDKILDNL